MPSRLDTVDRLLARLEASRAGEQRIHVDPFAPNVVCSRCAIVSYRPDLDHGCPVCGARTERKLGPNAWGSWPLADTPYGCPVCGLEHFGRDRVPSPLGCRCGMCPCGYDPLSIAVPGHDPQGNPGMYFYRPSPGAYVVLLGDEPAPPGSLVIDISDID